jgi:hypothetical protein
MKTEIGLTLSFIVGLVFKFMHIPGFSILLIISLMGLGILYFPSAIYFFSDKTIKKQNIALSVVSGFFLSIIPIGILFKIFYWPGGQLYMIVGSIAAPILLVVTYYLKTKASEDLRNYYKNMITRIMVLTFFAILFCVVSTTTLVNIQYRDNPEEARVKSQYFSNPKNGENRLQYEKYMMKQDSINMGLMPDNQ